MALHLIQMFSILSPPPLTPVFLLVSSFFSALPTNHKDIIFSIFIFSYAVCCALRGKKNTPNFFVVFHPRAVLLPHTQNPYNNPPRLRHCVSVRFFPPFCCVCLSLFRESEGKKNSQPSWQSRIERIARVPNFSCNIRFPSSVMFGREVPRLNVFLCRMFCASNRVTLGCVGNVNPDDDIENIDVNVAQEWGWSALRRMLTADAATER